MPKSATSKIGASGSLLMATIVLRALHADQMLNRAGDAEREVEFGRDGLT